MKRLSNAICYAILFLAAILMTAIGPMLSPLADEFGLSLSQSGLMYTAEFAGFTVFILLTGILSDKLGKRAVLTTTFIVLIISLYAFSVSGTFTASLIIMVFAGGFCGPLQSVMFSLVSDLNPETAARHIVIGSVFYGLGAVFGPVIAGVCLTYAVPWRTVYVGLSAICAVMLAVSFIVRIPKAAQHDKLSLPALKNIVKDWRFMLLCLCVFFYAGGECSAWGWMSKYMDVRLGFTVLKSAIAIGVFWLSIVAGRLVVLHIKASVRTVVGVLSVCAAVVTFSSAFTEGEVFVWVTTVLMGLTYSGIWPLLMGEAEARHTAHSGTTYALLFTGGGIAMAAIPALVGAAAEAFGVAMMHIIPALLFVGIFVVYLFVIARPEKA